jgi:uncharacterized protein YgbK (DUF1537 family)
MAGTASRVVTIIADDLTGACDTGCLFAGPGPVGVEAEPALLATGRAVITVDTESRPLPPDGAAAVVRATARRLRERLAAGLVFTKIDSTMRGAVATELTALLELGSRFTAALVCPAFPAQRRLVSHGHLLVEGVPVHESAIGRDPAFRAATSEMVGLLAGGAPVVALGLDDVRAGSEKVAHILDRHAGAIVAADAETDADLATLAEAALSRPGTLIAGSAGLGRAVSHVLGCEGPWVALPAGRARLIVIGSRHPASRAQLEALAGAGLAVVSADAWGHTDPAPAIAALAGGRAAVVASTTPPTSREAVARHLAQAAVRILERAEPDLVAVTGGDTAYALIRELRPRRFDLLGAPADGLALGRLTWEDGRELSLLTKAGGFGAADLLATLQGGTS